MTETKEEQKTNEVKDSKIKSSVNMLNQQDWKFIRLCFNRRLFASGSLLIFSLGVVAAFVAAALFFNSQPAYYIPLIIAILFIGVSLPGFFSLPHSILLVIGIFDKILGAVIFILGFPLAIFSLAWLVTDMIAIRIWNAATWIFRHSKLQNSLITELESYPEKENIKLIKNGLLPGNRVGFWGAEGDEGPFWAIEKDNENIKISCSKENFSPFLVNKEQLKNARLLIPRKIEDKEKKKYLIPYPVEHILELNFEKEGEKFDLTLVLGHLAAIDFAEIFVPDRDDVRKIAGKTSLLSIYSVPLSMLGPISPIGLILAITSLIRIKKSNFRLKGQRFSWIGIVAGIFFTFLFIALLFGQK